MTFETISIIITNWCRQKLLPGVVFHIGKQSYPKDKYELIIVDDDSPNKKEVFHIVKTLMDQYKKIKIRFFETYKQVTFNETLRYNIGVRQASNEIIIFNESDMFQLGEYLMRVNEVHRNNGRLFLSPTVLQCNEGKEATIVKRGHLVDLGGSIRRKHLEEIRGFDETYTGWGGIEDRLYYRLLSIGVSCQTDPNLKVLHLKWFGLDRPEECSRTKIREDTGRNNQWGKLNTLKEIIF